MKILIAADGSDFSIEAARKCCEMLAIDGDSSVTLISVAEALTAQTPFGTLDEYYILLRKAAWEAAKEIVESAEGKLREKLDDAINIETVVVKGKAAEQIIGYAEKINADLIVVGSHGRGFLGRMLLGSVSGRVTKHAPCSVLVVR